MPQMLQLERPSSFLQPDDDKGKRASMEELQLQVAHWRSLSWVTREGRVKLAKEGKHCLISYTEFK